MLKYILPIFLVSCMVPDYVPEPTPIIIPGAPPLLTDPYVKCGYNVDEYWFFSVLVWDESTESVQVGIYSEALVEVESHELMYNGYGWETTVFDSQVLDCRYPAMYGYHFTALDSDGNSSYVNATTVYTGL